MRSYLDTLAKILKEGDDRSDRTGVGTRGIFGVQTRYNLQDGFPAMTTKKLAWKAVVSELLWFLEGSGDERRLREIRHGGEREDLHDKKTIWTANSEAGYWKHKATYPGDLGRVYGVQWRHWQTFHSVGQHEDDLAIGHITEIDQIANLIDGLKNDPFGRRHLLTAWNPGELDNMALPPCHLLAQFNVGNLTDLDINNVYMRHRGTLTTDERKIMDVGREGRKKTIEDLRELGLPTMKLDCQMYQRSNDFFLGGPFNIASYSLLTHMIAQVCELEVGEFIHVNGDVHLYKNHFDQAEEQLSREPFPLPTLWLNPDITCIDDFTMDDIRLENYQFHPTIKAKMAV
jgi:thymidylate synthase